MVTSKKRNLTLKDVAIKLNTSTTTISNAFNRPDQLSFAKREKIFKACREIGYDGPNKAAQILRKGKSNIIALILADSLEYIVTDPVANTFIEGVTRILKEQHKHLLLYAGDSESIREIVDFVDGFICYGAPRNKALISQMLNQRKPLVTVDFKLENHPSVNIDDGKAAYEIAKSAVKPTDKVAIIGLRLIAANHTCRVYDTPLIELEHCVTHSRLEGYTRALKDVGITISGDLIWNTPENKHRYARQAAIEVLSSQERPDLILCMSDLIAIEVLQCANDMNIKVPEELRITGFDGINEAFRVTPNITTVCQLSVEKGVTAATMLLNGNTECVVLPYDIKLGGTL